MKKNNSENVSSLITNEDYQSIFEKDPTGQLILQDLTKRYCDISVFNTDPLEMSRAVGKQELVQEIIYRAVAGRKENIALIRKQKEQQKETLSSSELRRLARQQSGINLNGEYDDK